MVMPLINGLSSRNMIVSASTEKIEAWGKEEGKSLHFHSMKSVLEGGHKMVM